jgi:hypothetical protein
MKILRNGKPWSVTIGCSGKGCGGEGCGATLKIEEEDVIIVFGGAYNELIPYSAIECPQCKVRTCLDDLLLVKVPNRVFQAARLRHDERKNNKIPEKKIEPITLNEFNVLWQNLYGCTWDNSQSAKTYRGLQVYLTDKGFIKESN